MSICLNSCECCQKVSKLELQVEALKCAGFSACFRLALSLHAPAPVESVRRIKAELDEAAAMDEAGS